MLFLLKIIIIIIIIMRIIIIIIIILVIVLLDLSLLTAIFVSFQGRMIVLDLSSEVAPQFRRLDSYYGQPFIWCMLHDYGGVLTMYGVLDVINEVSIQYNNLPPLHCVSLKLIHVLISAVND